MKISVKLPEPRVKEAQRVVYVAAITFCNLPRSCSQRTKKKDSLSFVETKGGSQNLKSRNTADDRRQTPINLQSFKTHKEATPHSRQQQHQHQQQQIRTMKSFLLLGFSAVVALNTLTSPVAAFAFSSPALTFKRSTSTSIHATSFPLNDIDTMCIMNIAEFCASEECSLDDREALIARIEEQRDLHTGIVNDLDEALRHLNSSEQAMPGDSNVASLMESVQRALQPEQDFLNKK
jgi:hypothetical protein